MAENVQLSTLNRSEFLKIIMKHYNCVPHSPKLQENEALL